MKKNLLILLFLFTILFSSYAFDCDDKFYLRNPDDVMKIGDEIGLCFGDSYEIKNLNDYILDDDGWYRTSYCGKDMYVIYGSNYFLYHSNYEYGPYYNFGSSFLKTTSFDDFIKNDNMWSIQKNTEVTVPDFLTEKINNKSVQYNTADMENFYIRDWETNMQYVKYNAKPWATSKEPNHMIIDVNFSTSTDALVTIFYGL